MGAEVTTDPLELTRDRPAEIGRLVFIKGCGIKFTICDGIEVDVF
jgi:hypothetical protein